MPYPHYVVFSHRTALERLRSVPPQLGRDEPLGEPFYSIPFSSKTKIALQLDLESMGIQAYPLDLLVSKEERPTRSSRIRTHSAGLLEYPGWLMRAINRDTFTCGPELVFIQLAMKLPLIDAVVLGYELCGAYSHFAGDISGFYDRPPLTSVTAISEAISQLEGLRGIKKAEAALRWVRDGARSPMETVLSCCLSLPAPIGGLGFEAPELNYPVALDEAASKRAGSKTCFVDLAWPNAQRGLEYNGSEFHLDAARDRRRIEGLEHMGWSINTADLYEMRDFRRLWDLAGLLKGKVPRASEASPLYKETRTLHQQLLEATRFNLGMEGALFGVDVPRGLVTYHI